MKNLKLLQACQKTAVKGDTFCLDLDENIYFSCNKGIYVSKKGSNEVIFCSEFDPEEVDQQHHVIGMEFVIESANIFIASSSGNLYLYDTVQEQVSNIGIVDNGIVEFAWSPDQEFLVLLTGQNTFVLMTREFDPITEKNISAEEFGENKFINVGWGSKTTQFHGSEGKGAALVKQKEPMSALPYDDQRPRICWRNDGEYFVISSIDEIKGYRLLRIWSKDAVLQYTSEVLEGLEEPLAWRPVGDLVACSQQCPNKHKIIFIEKNGLKHGEFPLPFEPNKARVTILSWSNDSNVLAIAALESSGSSSDFQVMLWTIGNYHWYLKQKFIVQEFPLYGNLVMKWNSNTPLELHCYNQSNGQFYNLKWTQTLLHSPPQYNCDDSVIVSIDNENILVSPFGKLVPPPPLCGYKFILPSSVQSVFFAPDKPAFGAYLGNYKFAIFMKEKQRSPENIETTSNDCKFQLVAAGGNGFKSQVEPYSFLSIYNIQFGNKLLSCGTWPHCLIHWTWVKSNSLLCVCHQEKAVKSNVYSILHLNLSDFSPASKDIIANKIIDISKSVYAMCTNEDGSIVAVQCNDGEVFYIDIDDVFNSSEGKNASLLYSWKKSFEDCLFLNPPCPDMCIVQKAGSNNHGFIAGLAPNGNLEFGDLLTKQFVTSYFVQGGFLFFTTTSHLLNIHQFDTSKQNGKVFPETQQKVERKAKIIFVPPNSTKVILQMPRGNLETIHPRPLVLAAIFQYLDKLEFYKAFELAKVHRIDLNVLCDYYPKKFIENLKLFVEQLESKDLNLFLANLKPVNVCKDTYHLQCHSAEESKPDIEENAYFGNKVNILCEHIRDILDPDNKEHFLPYLATYALKKPPCLDEALLKIKSLKDSCGLKNTQDIVNQALEFLLYLVDVNELIDVAFGTYDLETTIMVAQKSQKDPKEFLPFYNDLQKLEENYRKFKIDMHLNRYKKALEHISKCDDHFDECLQLIKEKKLFVDSLYLFPETSEQNKTIWTAYGHYLESKSYFDEAGLVFSRIGEDELAFKSYRESGNWKESINAAYKLKYSDQKILGTCQYMVERLKDNGKYLEAGYVLEHFVKDVEEAIVTLIEGCEWSSALLLMSKHNRFDISETHLKPSLIMLHKTLLPELDLLLSDFNRHLSRLKYLRSPEKKRLDEEIALSSRYGDDDQFSEVTSVSDVASSHSEATRLSGSIMTRKSSKSRRKKQLKKYRLKEGSPDEDLALIVALSEIVRKVDGLKDNFLNNIRILVQYGYDKPAKDIQFRMKVLTSLIESEMSYIWSSNPITESSSQWTFGPDATANTIAASRTMDEKCTPSNQQDPQLAAPPWRNIDIFLNMLHMDVKT